MGLFGNDTKQEAAVVQREGKMQLMVTKFKRLPNHLFFCGTSSDGYITLNQTPMNHTGRPKKKKVE